MSQRIARFLVVLAPALILIGCGSVPKAPSPITEPVPSRQSAPAPAAPNVPALPPAGSGRGGYYQDDGPGENPPAGLQAIPDAEPSVEPYSKKGNRPYVVFGKTYTPITDERPFKQRGMGSWYGKKFHGQKTSSGELYDMYKMTAAHPTLPIPSYARVTNLNTGVQVIVRINDRGPFHSSRIIDLSYTAALKLGYLGKGSSELEVERLLPEEIARIAGNKQNQTTALEAQAPTPVVQALPKAEPGAASSVPAETSPGSLDAFLATLNQPRQAAAPVAAETAATDARIALPNGFYLQLGAYKQAGNAEAVRARLAQNWNSALPAIEVAQYGGFYRLYSGPFATRDEAVAAAQQIQNAGASRPLVVQR